MGVLGWRLDLVTSEVFPNLHHAAILYLPGVYLSPFLSTRTQFSAWHTPGLCCTETSPSLCREAAACPVPHPLPPRASPRSAPPRPCSPLLLPTPADGSRTCSITRQRPGSSPAQSSPQPPGRSLGFSLFPLSLLSAEALAERPLLAATFCRYRAALS